LISENQLNQRHQCAKNKRNDKEEIMISNMLNGQGITEIKAEELLDEVEKKRKENMRLVQISCTKKDNDFEITYSFEDGQNLENLRLNVPEDTEIESISGIYSYAFLYENEMKDLFGVKFKNLLVDFEGNLYKTAMQTPFA